uniref:Uncharacterized protein LOC111111217 n=1 Tax=Crassostrea virginica TaxID=6565 RepID=A0A8B8BLD9_CRAVI|nr:uncharacterized protein LOC111111217 [Crassostrea virginica]
MKELTKILSITVIFVIVAVSRGQKLKLSLEHAVGRWTFKGWGSTDFKGGWGGGIGVGFRFKRSTHAIPHTYNVLIQANQCLFDVYDQNGDEIITLEEMTRLFEDKELGANLYEDLHMFKDTPGVTKSVFNERVSLVINGCKSTTDARP